MQINHPGTPHISFSSVRARLVAFVATACVGALTLSACGDGRAASSPTTVAPTTVSPAPAPAPAPDAPSKASRDGGDNRDETAGEAGSAEQDDEAPDGGFEGDRLVRGIGPRGHDAR